MSAGDKSSKTEKPTPKRKREAHEKGQIAKTPELAIWGGLLVSVTLVETAVRKGSDTFTGIFRDMQRAASEPTTAGAANFFGAALAQAALIVAPICLGLLAFVIVVSLAQVGLKPSAKRLKPDFKRLNLFKGIKQMFSSQAGWELGKSLLKTVLLGVIALPIVSGAIGSVMSSGGSLNDIVGITGASASRVAKNIAMAGLTIAAVDYIVQKRRIMRELMMTKQEVREEMRNTEGDPRTKQAIRSRQQAIGRNRMITMVATSDVVVVNPTHYAVALRYDSAKGAPELVAKGAGIIARRIREEAELHGIPVIHEPYICRTMYRTCAVGQLIPVGLYEAVAQVLAFVFALRSRGQTGGYHELDAHDSIASHPLAAAR